MNREERINNLYILKIINGLYKRYINLYEKGTFIVYTSIHLKKWLKEKKGAKISWDRDGQDKVAYTRDGQDKVAYTKDGQDKVAYTRDGQD